MAPERKVPIQKSDFHVLDEEFQSVRGRFEAEMRKMEEEMSRLRSKLQDQDRSSSGFRSSASLRMSTTEESSSSSSSSGHREEHSNGGSSWTEELNSPLIQDGKNLKLRFDVSDYAPEEIVVKTIDNKLKVSAKHEEKSPNKTLYREYNREFMLPAGTNPELIKSSLSKDGVLTVDAPLPSLRSLKERTIPIDKC